MTLILPPEIMFQVVLVLCILCAVATKAAYALPQWAGRPKTQAFHPSDVLLAVLLCGLVGLLSLSLPASPNQPSLQPPTKLHGVRDAIAMLISGSLLNAVVLCIIWFWLGSVRGQLPSKLFGLGGKPLPEILKLGSIYLAPAFVVVVGLNILTTHLLLHFQAEAPAQEAVEILQGGSGRAMQVASFILAVVMAPIFEEILFRGLLFGSMRTVFPLPIAVVLSSLLFGAVHMNAAAFLSLSVLGMVMAIAFAQTKCLWVNVAIHMLFNLIMSLSAILV